MFSSDAEMKKSSFARSPRTWAYGVEKAKSSRWRKKPQDVGTRRGRWHCEESGEQHLQQALSPQPYSSSLSTRQRTSPSFSSELVNVRLLSFPLTRPYSFVLHPPSFDEQYSSRCAFWAIGLLICNQSMVCTEFCLPGWIDKSQRCAELRRIPLDMPVRNVGREASRLRSVWAECAWVAQNWTVRVSGQVADGTSMSDAESYPRQRIYPSLSHSPSSSLLLSLNSSTSISDPCSPLMCSLAQALRWICRPVPCKWECCDTKVCMPGTVRMSFWYE